MLTSGPSYSVFERFFSDVVDKSSINPLKETSDTAEHRFKSRCEPRLNGGHRLRGVPVVLCVEKMLPPLPPPLLLCGCRDRLGWLSHARARTHPREHARSLPACDARCSVLPSKLVALATLSSDLNMVAFLLKNVSRLTSVSVAMTAR